MIKGYVSKDWPERAFDKNDPSQANIYKTKGMHYDWDGWPPFIVDIFTAEEMKEVKKLLENIRIMARNDPGGLAKEIIKDSEAAIKILEGGDDE